MTTKDGRKGLRRQFFTSWDCTDGKRRGIAVKILLPETEQQGFAEGGEQIAPREIRRIAGGPQRRREKCVKILLPGTKPQGLAEGGEQTAPLKRPSEAAGGAESL